MIKFTKLTDYAIATLCLMVPNPDKSISSLRASDITLLPVTTVSKIFFALLEAEVLLSIRGRTGGYKLAREASEISLLDIIQAVEGEVCLVDCSRVSPNGIEKCLMGDNCCASAGLRSVNNAVVGIFRNTSLQNIYDESHDYQNEICLLSEKEAIIGSSNLVG